MRDTPWKFSPIRGMTTYMRLVVWIWWSFPAYLKIYFFLVWEFLRVLSFTGHQNTPHETFLISCCKLARANTLQVNAGQIFWSTSSIQQCPSVHNLQRIIITALSMKHNSKAPLMNTKRKSREWFTLNTNTDRVGVGVRELISRGCLMCFLFLRRNQLQNDEQVVNFHDFSAP